MIGIFDQLLGDAGQGRRPAAAGSQVAFEFVESRIVLAIDE